MSISVGAVGTASTVVTPENTAAAVGSGSLPVKLNVSHDAATPVGMHVTAKAEPIEVDRRRLVFRVTASDDAGPIGQGTHERFLIMAEKFLAKAEAKKG